MAGSAIYEGSLRHSAGSERHLATTANEIRATRIFVREHFLELCDRELMDWFGLFACHEAFPSDYERIMA